MGSVTVISDTIQEFNGERFYKCGNYFQHLGKRLHRVVWQYFNGEVPEGFHVHHVDGNRYNNDISNLALVDGIEHVNAHAKEETRRENGRKAIKLAIKVAPEWHRSKEGKEWHSQQSKERWAKAKMNTYTCDFCGKEYQTKAVRHVGYHFCCNNCKAAYRRRRLRDENKKD